MTPDVVQFGAGAIGRGFLAHLWHKAGLSTGFVEASQELVQAINDKTAYPLRLVDGTIVHELTIDRVQAVPVTDAESVCQWLAGCRFAATAVGVHAFESLAPIIAGEIAERAHQIPPETWQEKPFNMICCENQKDAGALLRKAVQASLDSSEVVADYFNSWCGFVDASVGRMVPPQTERLHAEHPLLLVAEPYAELPVDAVAWKGKHPEVPGVHLRENFAGYVARKLYTHNGGHALLAYLGYRQGHSSIHQCADDPQLVLELQRYWRETGAALIVAYGFDEATQRSHEADLLQRFRNPALGDTVARVARDPARKLRKEDRLVGAALLCLENGFDPQPAAHAVAAALHYDFPEDPAALAVQESIQKRGVADAFSELSSLSKDHPLVTLVESAYNSLR
ncbi:MAG: mannitol-1-phosphate 5-dehydrogenase [Armatimonadaceae bacterium]